MNFIDYLMKPVTPLGVYWKDGKGHHHRDTSAAVRAHKGQAATRYMKAIGDGWTRTHDIERRLGYSRGTAFKTLVAMEKNGLIERRAAGASDVKTKAGWMWRVK